MRERRKQERADRVREEILDAATTVFERGGIEAATLAEIAEEAGFGVSSLYAYFESKTALINGAVDSFAAEALAIFELPRLEAESFRAYFERLVRQQFLLAERRRGIFEVLRVERNDAVQRPGIAHEDGVRWMQLLGALLQTGIDEGAFRDADVLMMSFLVEGSMYGIACARFGGCSPIELDAAVDAATEFIFSGFGAATESD